MSNRGVDEELYGRPNSTGVVMAVVLMLAALIAGVVVLSQVDKAPRDVGVISTDAVSVTTTVPGADDTTAGSTIAPSAGVLRDPALVNVIAINGSGVNKAAGKTSTAIAVGRYKMLTPRDANQRNYADAVFYQPGFQAEAQAIANLLGQIDKVQADGSVIAGLADVRPVPAEQTILTPPVIPAFDIEVMVGPGLAKRYAQGVVPGGVTTTTAAA